MKKYALIGLCIVFGSLAYADFLDTRIVTQVAFDKLINGDAGTEFMAKGSIQLSDDVQLKLGLSEGFTAPRSSWTDMNHCGTRLDIGAEWRVLGDYWLTYTHSDRNYFAGANPIDVYSYDSVDQIAIRTEFNFSLKDIKQ